MTAKKGTIEYYEIFKDTGRPPVKNRSKAPKRATYVDVRPSDSDRAAVTHLLEDNMDTLGLWNDNMRDSGMKITIKADVAHECWVLSVCDGTVDYNATTYYVFRHSVFAKVVAHFMYVLTEKWQGFLPRDAKKGEDIHW